MKSFLINITYFTIPLLIFILVGVLSPVTPRASQSLLMSAIKKDSLLQNTPSPRMIFVGGSNLSFGLNSKIIHDSLGINPINTGIHASIGLKFMMDNTLNYIRKGDIVILIPEYNHFYRDVDFGSVELLRMVFDVKRHNIKLLNDAQLLKLVPFIPKYAVSKYIPIEYTHLMIDPVYSVNSFNEYGDVFKHWDMEQQDFSPYGQINSAFEYDNIEMIKEFNSSIKEKGASLYITYPSLQATSYNNAAEQIKRVENELQKINLKILGTPEKYKIPDSMMFNTPYHLLKKGVDYRTKLFIEDFTKASKNNTVIN